MAFDGFLWVKDVPGECKDTGKNVFGKHDNGQWIDVTSFSYSVNQSTSVDTGGGLTAGKATLGDFVFTQKYHKGSPALWVYCASGEHIKEVKFEARKSAGKEQMIYLTLVFKDCVVTSVQTSGGGDNEIPDETVQMAYTQVDFEYWEQGEDGKQKGGSSKTSYNRKTNTRK
jgi:type VI secretion system secreted protein Hcp